MNTTQQLEAFKSYMNYRRYSKNTIKTYSDALQIFFKFNATENLEQLTIEHLIKFNNEHILKNNYSASYQNQVINAIKLFYRNRFDRTMEVDFIQRPRREKRLPNILSKLEVKSILESPINLKHRAMLS